jgi:CRP-like cAMP-binding protein
MASIEKLKEIDLLSDLEDAELQALLSVITTKNAAKGSFIVCADDPGASLMFVSSGLVKISLMSNDGKEIILAHLGKGEFFGELAMLTGEERSANVIAAEDSEILALSAEDFKQHILANTGLSLALMRELAVRLRNATSKIGDLALYDVYRRVARTLKSIGTLHTEGDKRYYVIEKRPTHQDLASMVGTGREMVTRALKGLEEDGCITIDGKRLTLHSIPR